MIWAILPAAGRGSRFGGDVPKQYLDLLGEPLIAHALRALLSHPQVQGVMVALAADDVRWPGWATFEGKPVRTCIGGRERADSVRAALQALAPSFDGLVLVHDAARPNLHADDLSRLIAEAEQHAAGALLAAPVRDTLKHGDAADCVERTMARDRVWRAFTPQAFRAPLLLRALDAAVDAGALVTDEASAVERLGLAPRLVEGREDNLKVTTPSDLAVLAALMSQLRGGAQ